MDKVSIKLTVFFENPFWVGVFERTDGNRLAACRTVFGAEPKDYDVYAFILGGYSALRFSPALEVELRQTADNPKRRQRNAQKQMERAGTGTKSQQALSLQRDVMKTERKRQSREQRDAEACRRFELKRQKRKEKHRGR